MKPTIPIWVTRSEFLKLPKPIRRRALTKAAEKMLKAKVYGKEK